MQKSKFSSYFLTFSILTFAASFFYIVQKSYDSLMKPITEVKQSVIIRPIDPNLDITTLDEIEKREEINTMITPVPTEVISPVITP
jgi:hypothetical protein